RSNDRIRVVAGGLSQSDQKGGIVGRAAHILNRGEHAFTMNRSEFARWKMITQVFLLACRDQNSKRTNLDVAQLGGELLQIVISAEMAFRQVNDYRKGKQASDSEHQSNGHRCTILCNSSSQSSRSAGFSSASANDGVRPDQNREISQITTQTWKAAICVRSTASKTLFPNPARKAALARVIEADIP